MQTLPPLTGASAAMWGLTGGPGDVDALAAGQVDQVELAHPHRLPHLACGATGARLPSDSCSPQATRGSRHRASPSSAVLPRVDTRDCSAHDWGDTRAHARCLGCHMTVEGSDFSQMLLDEPRRFQQPDTTTDESALPRYSMRQEFGP